MLSKEDKTSLFILSAPSGTGKSSLIKHLIKSEKNIELSVSATTRPPRDGEINAEHYFFISKEEFDDLKNKNAFLEHATVYNHQYGTLRSYVEKKINANINLILDIDTQGFEQIKESNIVSTSIFILPPSIIELEKRLIERNLDSNDVIKLRLENAKKELDIAYEYDCIVLNDDFNRAFEALKSIIFFKKEIQDDTQNKKILRDLLS